MGESSKKKQRIQNLAHLAVGPAEFTESDLGYLFYARTDADSLMRLASAIGDLTSKPQLLSLLRSSGAGRINPDGWVVITAIPEGPVSFKLIAGDDSATQLTIDLFGEGFVARGIRWSTLVFGSFEDVDAIKKAVYRFGDDLPPPGTPLPQPKLSVSHEARPRMRLEVTRADVEQMNLAPSLLFLDTYAHTTEILEHAGPNFVIEFSGYDDDQRFLAEIPGVKSFIDQLCLFAPWAPVVAHPSTYMLWVKSLCDECSIKTDNTGTTAIDIPAGVADKIAETLGWNLAELMAERLIVDPNDHPAFMETMHSWAEFLSSGQSSEYQAYAAHVDLEPSDTDIPSTSNEREFWESMVEATSPGWTAYTIDDETGDAPRISGREVIIYAIDTRSGRIYSAGLTLSEAERILRSASNPHASEGAPSIAIQTIRDIADAPEVVDPYKVKLAILASWLAIGITSLVGLVREQFGDIKGHYFYMVYSMRDGGIMGRSTFVGWEGAGTIPLNRVFDFAAETIQTDLEANGHVGSTVRKGGGLILCETLQKLGK